MKDKLEDYFPKPLTFYKINDDKNIFNFNNIKDWRNIKSFIDQNMASKIYKEILNKWKKESEKILWLEININLEMIENSNKKVTFLKIKEKNFNEEVYNYINKNVIKEWYYYFNIFIKEKNIYLAFEKYPENIELLLRSTWCKTLEEWQNKIKKYILIK